MRWFLIGMSGLLTLSCQKNATDCERERVHLARAYYSLKQAATERKLAGISAEKWGFVENKTDLLESAFATPQITWSSADKARSEVAGSLNDISTTTEGALSLFKETAKGVFEQQERFKNQCR
jgi:hypothetical protein